MDPGIRSARADELFAESATLSRYLEVEAAIAACQAQLGVIPDKAAQSIAAFAHTESIDRDRYRQDLETVGFPIVGLVRQLAEIVPEGHGEFVHWGATTQDIMDTGLVLALRGILAWVEDSTDGVIANLIPLAEQHRRTLMIGRSQMQHAVPITFGYKVAGWLAPLLRHRCRLAELRPRLLQVQFGGAVGTLASLGAQGFEVRRLLADQLGLGEPVVSWHTQRDALVELVTFFSLLTGSLSKIATDVMLLAQTEVGEVQEPVGPGRGVSSTMPQKRNPVLSQQIIVAGRLVRSQAGGMIEAMVQDHERGSATWQLEWTLVPDAASHTLAALERMVELTGGLEVHPDRMRENLELTDHLVFAEAIMMALAPHVGRQRAHDLVDAAVAETRQGVSFVNALHRSKEISGVLAPADLKRIFDGEAYVDAADHVVADVLDIACRPKYGGGRTSSKHCGSSAS
jgi:3-carboxy-cis,cis-muconate cycloisomerase